MRPPKVQKRFFVTGLPRSRTAWFSIAAQTPVSICHHEPTKHCRDFDDLVRYWTHPDVDYVGVSDSGLVHQAPRILEELQPRTLVIERDPLHVKQSFAKYMAGVEHDRMAAAVYIDDAEAALRKIAGPLVRRVKYEALDDYAVVSDCFEWLMPGNPFGCQPDLMWMRVEAIRDKVLTHAHKFHTGFYKK